MSTTVTAAWEITGRTNGRPQSRRLIGWLTLAEPADYTQYGEYAADYAEITVPAGRYPIYALRDCGQPWHSLLIPMPGVVKSGSWWNKLQPGTPLSYALSPYAHALAKAILAGEASHIELLPGVEAREIPFEYNGQPQLTYGIFADGEKC